MRDIRTFKAADNVRHGIHLADVFEEFIAKPFALRRSLHKSRNIDKPDARRCRLLGVIEIGQHLEARIRHRHHTHIRLNRAERIIRCLCARLRDRIEQRTLAHVRQTDDSNFQIAHVYSLFH